MKDKFLLILVAVVAGLGIGVMMLQLDSLVGQAAISRACVDSDGGARYQYPGTTSYMSTTFQDVCLSSGELQEYYCNNGIKYETVFCEDVIGEGSYCAMTSIGAKCVYVPTVLTISTSDSGTPTTSTSTGKSGLSTRDA